MASSHRTLPEWPLPLPLPLPPLQAMSMGLPSIVTNWSGTADFVDESVGYLVNFTLSKVWEEGGGAQVWATYSTTQSARCGRREVMGDCSAGRNGSTDRPLCSVRRTTSADRHMHVLRPLRLSQVPAQPLHESA